MGDRRRRRLALAAAGALALLATGGGMALAGKKPKPAPIAPDGTITACAKVKKGDLRLVASASACKHNEQVVTWNVKGPKGDPGDGPANAGSVIVGTLQIDGGTAVPIHSFSFGATNTTSVGGSGGGAGTGKVNVADVEALKDLDALTLDITEGVFKGKHFPQVIVQLYDPGATTVRAKYTFDDVFFTATQQFSAGALERTTFAWTKVRIDLAGDAFQYDQKTGK